MSQQQPPGASYSTPPSMSPRDEKLWATLIHVGGIVAAFLPAMVGYVLLKDRGPFIREHSATALNFQLTLVVASLVGLVTVLLGIGILILMAVWVVSIVFSILAAVTSNSGRTYRYPLAIPFVQ